MAGFCKYCGTALNDNSECTCEAFIASKATVASETAPAPVAAPTVEAAPAPAPVAAPAAEAAPAPAPVAAPVITPTAAPAPMAPPPAQPSQALESTTQQFNTSKKMFMDFIKDPLGMISNISSTSDKVSPLIFGGINALLMFLNGWINLANGADAKECFKVGLLMLFLDAFTIAALAGITLLLAKKFSSEIKFLDATCIFCIATIPASAMIIASLFFNIPVRLLDISSGYNLIDLLMMMGLISWGCVSFIAMFKTVKSEQFKVFWIILGSIVFLFALDYVFAQNRISDIISHGLVDEINDWANDFNDLFK